METLTGTTAPPTGARAAGPDLPTRADLDAATAATVAVIADPAATAMDRYRAAEAEEAVTTAYLQRPGAAAELEAGV
jgi:hypothetical protein